MLKDRKLSVGVHEGNIPEFNFAFESFGLVDGIGSIDNVGLGVIYLHNLCGGGRESLEFIHDVT